MSPKKAAIVGRVTKKDTSMDHAEVTKMLGYLKYHKAKARSATPMRRLLPKLHASTDRCLPVRKRLVKVSKEQEGLVVDTSLHECVNEVSTQKEASISSFFNPFEIVQMSGFEPSSMQAGLDFRVFLTY